MRDHWHPLHLIILLAIIYLMVGSQVMALPKKSPLSPAKFLNLGVFSGGHAKISEVSLIGVDKKFNRRHKVERIILTFGDGKGFPSEYSGYYHVAVERDPPRVIVDLSRMQKTAVNETEMAKIFKSSVFVRAPELTMDPEDHTTNLTLNLKGPMEVAAYERKNSPQGAQLVLDIRPEAKPVKDQKRLKK